MSESNMAGYYNSRLVISKKKIPLTIAVVILTIYCFSRGGIGLLVSNTNWAILLMVAALMAVLAALTNIRKNQFQVSQFLVLLMIIEILVWNNNDLKNGDWFLTYIFCVIYLFWIVAMFTDSWFEIGMKMMLIMAAFHAFWTLVCYFSSDVYYSVVYPIVNTISYYSLQNMYERGFITGFNYSNSQNAIYLTMGLCICAVKLFFANKKLKNNKKWLLLSLIFMICLLFTGKRGPVVWFLAGFVVTYYFYHCDKPMGRLFKIVALAVFAVVIFTITAPLIPGLDNFIQRFIEMENSGDVTTGRTALWGMGLTGFFSSPVLGHGWFWFKYNNVFGEIYHVHNCYIQWLCELGIIGSLAFFVFVVKSYTHIVKMVKGFRTERYRFTDFHKVILVTALLYETYFLLYSFAGTSFYEPECLLPYVFLSAMSEYIWSHCRIKAKLE